MNMPHFMVLCYDGQEEPAVKFFEKMDETDSYVQDATCGANLLCQVYEWDTSKKEYMFLYE